MSPPTILKLQRSRAVGEKLYSAIFVAAVIADDEISEWINTAVSSWICRRVRKRRRWSGDGVVGRSGRIQRTVVRIGSIGAVEAKSFDRIVEESAVADRQTLVDRESISGAVALVVFAAVRR